MDNETIAKYKHRILIRKIKYKENNRIIRFQPEKGRFDQLIKFLLSQVEKKRQLSTKRCNDVLLCPVI